MSMGQSSMTPADVAAVVDNNRGSFGFGYPVMPMMPFGGFGGGYGNGFGGDFIWVILLLALFGGWGGGFGGGFGGIGGAGLADGGLLGYAIGNNATKGDLTSITTSNKIDNVSTQLCNGFADVQSAICNGVNSINTGLLTGFGNTQLQSCQNTNAITNAIDNNRFAALQSANAIQAQIAQNGYNAQQCCCDVKTAIANSDNLNFRNTCDIENMIQAQTTAIKEDGEKTRSLIIANKIEELERQLSQKDRELQTARFDASQTAQTAALRLALENQNNEFYQRLSDCPIPSMPVYGMTPIFRCNGNGYNGCGCNGSQFI